MDAQDPTKERLLQAAGAEFADKGFACARIRSICDRAQANVAAVHYHFGDKEQLYVEAVLQAHRCGIGCQEEPMDDQADPTEQLRGFIRHFLSRVLALHDLDGWEHRLLTREMLNPTSASDILIQEGIRPRFEQLLGILRRFCPEAEERKLHALAFGVIGQCLHYKMARTFCERLIGPEGMAALDLDFLTDHITTFCLAALGRLPALNASGVAETEDAARV